MKKILVSLELLLIVAFLTFNNVSAYVSNEITYSVSYQMYDTKKENFIPYKKSVLVFMHNKGAYLIENNKAEYKLYKPNKKGYKFDGWYYDKDFKTKVEDNDVRNISLESFRQSSQTLYGRWFETSFLINIVFSSLIFILVFIIIIISIIFYKKYKKVKNKITKKTPNK